MGKVQKPPPQLNAGEHIDVESFGQVRDMDGSVSEGEGDPSFDPFEFSRGIKDGFFEQSESTFRELDESLKKKDLDSLSSLGHFLKGSSATLGCIVMKTICEKIQHLGQRLDETGSREETEPECLRLIESELVLLKEENGICKDILNKHYDELTTWYQECIE